MTQDTQIVLPFARLSGKNLQADFAGGTLSSDGGVLFLRETEAHVGHCQVNAKSSRIDRTLDRLLSQKEVIGPVKGGAISFDQRIIH